MAQADGYAISRQNNLELHLGCHTCWMSYFTLVCLWCGRTDFSLVLFLLITQNLFFFFGGKGESWLPFLWWNWDHRLLDVIQHYGTRYTEYPFLYSAKILFNLFLTLWNVDYIIKECETVSYNAKTKQRLDDYSLPLSNCCFSTHFSLTIPAAIFIRF